MIEHNPETSDLKLKVLSGKFAMAVHMKSQTEVLQTFYGTYCIGMHQRIIIFIKQIVITI